PPPGQAAPEQDTNNFNLVWVTFKVAEWTSKPPPHGIGTLWKYIMPGRDPTGTVGVAYYVGELAVCMRVVAREHAVERFHAAQEALTAAVSSRSASVQASKNTGPSKPSTRKTNASSRKPKSPVVELKSSSNPPIRAQGRVQVATQGAVSMSASHSPS
ncbi:hypothetical protein JG687_00015455, partial [Phytophthora cactorum]